MSDSSDEEDLEALRQEALRSLKSRNQASSKSLLCSSQAVERTGSTSHQHDSSAFSSQDGCLTVSRAPYQHSSPSRNWSLDHEEVERFQGDRNHRRQDARKESTFQVNSKTNSLKSSNTGRSGGTSRSFRERPFEKQNLDPRSFKEFNRSYSTSRNQMKNTSVRRNARSPLRRSRSPDPRHSNRDLKPVSLSKQRKYPRRSNRDSCQRSLSKQSESQDEKSTDPLSSLPLCAPKHYVELFYGKKLMTDHLNDLTDSNLVINDEDRALLSEKSLSEREPVLSSSNEASMNSDKLGESIRETGPSTKPTYFRNNIVTHQVERIKETLRNSSPSSSQEGVQGGRLFSQSRVSSRRINRDSTRLGENLSSRKNRSDASLLEEYSDEEKHGNTVSELNKPLDPVLEARRKKFESNDVVKAVSKRIKLSNSPAKTNLVQTNESDDLRNMLIAKHREKSMLTTPSFEDKFPRIEDHQCFSAFSPFNTRIEPSEEVLAQSVEPSSDSWQRLDNVLSMDDAAEGGDSKTSDQVRVKVEVETDVNETYDLNPSESTNLEQNSRPPCEESNNLENFVDAPSSSALENASKIENAPPLVSADFIPAVSIKKEPELCTMDETSKKTEEKPIIDEPDLIPQQPDKPEDSATAGPMIKIKPLTELLDKKVLKKVKKRKKEERKNAKKKKKHSKSKEKERERGSRTIKLSKRTTKLLSQSDSRKESFPTRIVRSALEEALGKKKRKTFESEDETVIPTANLDLHSGKDHRKVLILDESEIDKQNEELSLPTIAADESEGESDNRLEEDSENDNLTFRLSSKAPLYSSTKSKKRPGIYKMLKLNQV